MDNILFALNVHFTQKVKFANGNIFGIHRENNTNDSYVWEKRVTFSVRYWILTEEIAKTF